jgi:hypothetical protein
LFARIYAISFHLYYLQLNTVDAARFTYYLPGFLFGRNGVWFPDDSGFVTAAITLVHAYMEGRSNSAHSPAGGRRPAACLC